MAALGVITPRGHQGHQGHHRVLWPADFDRETCISNRRGLRMDARVTASAALIIRWGFPAAFRAAVSDLALSKGLGSQSAQLKACNHA